MQFVNIHPISTLSLRLTQSPPHLHWKHGDLQWLEQAQPCMAVVLPEEHCSHRMYVTSFPTSGHWWIPLPGKDFLDGCKCLLNEVHIWSFKLVFLFFPFFLFFCFCFFLFFFFFPSFFQNCIINDSYFFTKRNRRERKKARKERKNRREYLVVKVLRTLASFSMFFWLSLCSV